MTEPSHAVFLSYASQDAQAAQRICEPLRAAGIEVWLHMWKPVTALISSMCEGELARIDEAASQYYLAMAYHKLGLDAQADRSLVRFNVLRGGEAGSYETAAIHAQRGNSAKALGLLEQALRDREQDLRFLKVDPLLDPVRNEPRFQAVKRQLKFPDD